MRLNQLFFMGAAESDTSSDTSPPTSTDSTTSTLTDSVYSSPAADMDTTTENVWITQDWTESETTAVGEP
ncbi:unnamed protein product [Dicrocoelium dendriticum]|nr:unnamed protein product [Dicrocoelium dendriticum]